MRITQEQIEKLTEILVSRVQEANIIFLESIGSSIKKIGELTPSKAQQLIQILKYGGNFNEIQLEIARLLNTNIETIDIIFREYAKKDQQFYKQFYQYRNVPFVPYEKNNVLKKQVRALASITKGEMAKYSRTNSIGYSIRGLDGRVRFMGLRETYDRILDEAFINIGQGKEDFNSAMRNIMKELGGSGLKTVDYASGRSVRMDSIVRMHLMNNLTELHDRNQEIFGKEFNADGVEISVHELPAPDHEKVQGRQFSNEEYQKLQDGLQAKDYNKKIFQITHSKNGDFRAIGEYNCYHYTLSIVLGVSKPEYNEKQLQDKINKANEIIEIDGKKYTKYECTQLQRKYERDIRKQKDIQILGKSLNDEELVLESQRNITNLTRKYKEISAKAELPVESDRLRVTGYRRINIAKMK